MKFAAPLILILGLCMGLVSYLSWKDYSSYSETTEGVVEKRTPTFCSVRIKGKIPGGSGSIEIPFSRISGSKSDIPPDDGPAYKIGDKVVLIHQPGEPHVARLKEAHSPRLPIGFGAASLLMLPLSIGLWWLDARNSRNRSSNARIESLKPDREN
jgi:hypothetical protein